MNTVETITMVCLTIDGLEVTVPKGTTVYNAAKQLGIDIPIFCYQDRMPPFGACRMCLVEVERMPKLQASCTLEATEGMVVKTQSASAEEGRKSIIEFLLINHPLDCPICDRGGECPLQDNAMKCGPGKSRFFEEKRRFKKPLPLGPVLMLDRERCIACARCTRFGDIVAGDHALEFIDRGFRTEVGTPDGGPVESKFIGNTIMICPVGALTSRVYRFRARPWDNDPTDSTCSLCPVGCSMIFDARDGEVMRTRARENRDVNDIWMCDKGWFGYEFTDSVERLSTPLIRRKGALIPTSWEEALTLIASKINEVKSNGKLAGWGGNPLTVEENFLFQQLLRDVIGSPHVDHRIGMPLLPLREEGLPPGMQMPLKDTEELSYAVLFGLDITEEFPVIWLRLKQAINKGAQVVFIGHFAPEVAPHLSQTILHAPGKEMDALKRHSGLLTDLMAKGGKGALFLGRQYLATRQRADIISEIARLKKNTSDCSINIMEGQGNSIGARFAGMHPELAPENKPPKSTGLDYIQVLKTAATHGWDYLHVAGTNPAARVSKNLWKAAREKLGFLVVQDLFLTETAAEADVVLPTLCYSEKDGSFINIEGRVLELHRGKQLPAGPLSDLEIFASIAERVSGARSQEPGDGGVELKAGSQELEAESQKKDALAVSFAVKLFDAGVRMRHNPHVSHMIKEPYVRIHPNEASSRSLQDGQRVSLRANGAQIEAALKLDLQVAEGTIVLPLGFTEVPVYDLDPTLLNGLKVEVQS